MNRDATPRDVVLVTGGAGYIGSHVVLALRDAGRQVVVIDNLVTGNRRAVPADVPFHQIDAGDDRALNDVLDRYEVGAVMHFAGSIVVPESVTDPLKYYRNNTVVSLSLIERCIERRIEKFIFSSTAAVYGAPEVSYVTETTPTFPISPYGWSKLMTERVLEDTAIAYPWFRPVRLRYFNVAGADPKGRSGQQGPDSTHLVRVAIETALGRRPRLDVFGDQHGTRDGTCERDYIHVSDLADAHIAALFYLEQDGGGTVFNCGYGRGVTVLEVIAAIEQVTGRALSVGMAASRPGDPPALIADSSKMKGALHWTPKYPDILEIVGSALRWQASLAGAAR